ncbi:MAG: hypothetical protein ACM3PF_06800 [Bacteroidota bacterium]
MSARATKHLMWACAAAAALFTIAGPAAAETDQEYLQRKLSFRYVEQPNDITKGSDILDNSAIATGTESGAFWTAHLPGLQATVRALIKPPGKGGDGNLQYVASQIVHVLDKPVIIMLLNDSGTLNTSAFNHWDACNNGHGKAWPCAFNFSNDDDRRADCAKKTGKAVPGRRDAIWAGQMALGEAVFTGDPGWATSTFIHELVHTQDRSDGRPHMFWLTGRSYNYGADGSHYGVEAVPNLAATYQEGIANTLRLIVNEKRRKEMFDWFANNDVVYVEKALVPPGTGPDAVLPCDLSTSYPSDDIWLYQQLKKAGAHEITPSGGSPAGPGYAYFKIRDIPPRFIVHNEYILSLTFSEYARHMGLPKFMAALKANDATLYRVSTSPVAQLYNTLCFAGLEGRPLSSVTGVNEAGPKPYLIPLAYADYFTGYTSKTKADYAAIFEGMLRSEWVDLYWDGYKDAVRGAVPIDASHTPKFDDLTSIAIALGVNSSTASH